MRIELVAAVVSMIGAVAAAAIVAYIALQTAGLQSQHQTSLVAATQSFEAQKPFLEKQLDLYLEAVKVATSIAISPNSDNRADMERRFWALYWGELAVVEDQPVVKAMIAFGNTLKSNSESGSELKEKAIALAHACRNSLKARWAVDLGDYVVTRPKE